MSEGLSTLSQFISPGRNAAPTCTGGAGGLLLMEKYISPVVSVQTSVQGLFGMPSAASTAASVCGSVGNRSANMVRPAGCGGSGMGVEPGGKLVLFPSQPPLALQLRATTM